MNVALKNPWLCFRSWWDWLDFFYSFGHLIPSKVRGKKILTIYDTIYEELPHCYPPGVPEQQRKEVAPALQQAWAVVADSESTAHSLRTFYQLSKPVLVTHAAARSEFRPACPELPTPDKPYLLFVGRMDMRKNVPQLVQAYREVVATGCSCSLVLVGPDDSGSEELAGLLARQPLPGEEIRRPGYLPEDALLTLYQGAAAFVYPSQAEGFGLPVLEAMACGVPVITSNCSALAEVASGAALLVNPNSVDEIKQAILSLLTDSSLRTELVAKGLGRASEFSWKKSAQIFWNGLVEQCK